MLQFWLFGYYFHNFTVPYPNPGDFRVIIEISLLNLIFRVSFIFRSKTNRRRKKQYIRLNSESLRIEYVGYDIKYSKSLDFIKKDIHALSKKAHEILIFIFRKPFTYKK